jgi:CHAT domain-containing protein
MNISCFTAQIRLVCKVACRGLVLFASSVAGAQCAKTFTSEPIDLRSSVIAADTVDAGTSAEVPKQLEEARNARRRLTKGSLREAARLYAVSADCFLRAGRPALAAVAQIELGDTYVITSSYLAALAAYRSALRAAPQDSPERCTALSRLVRTHANIGQTRNAQSYVERALQTCNKLPSSRAKADALEAEGELQFWSLQPAAATTLAQARDLSRSANDTLGAALATMILAEAINAKDQELAKTYAQDALDTFQRTDDLYDAARVHMVLGFFASDEGEFDRARCHCRSALSFFEHVADRDNAAIALNVMGMADRKMGDRESALREYQLARADFAAAHDELGEAESITGIGDVLVDQGRYRSILPLYRAKLRIAHSTGNKALLASAAVNVGDSLAYQRDYQEAEASYREGIAEYRNAGNRYGERWALTRLNEMLVERHDNKKALESLDEAEAVMTGDVEGQAKVNYLRSSVYLYQGRFHDARAEIKKTTDAIESQRLRIAKFDSRAAYFASVHKYYSLDVDILMALDRSNPGQGYKKEAFEASERSKVRAFIDQLDHVEVHSICDSAENATAAPKVQPALQVKTQVLTLEQLSGSILDEDTVLVEFDLGDRASSAWLIDHGNLSSFELARSATILKQVRAFRQALLPIVSAPSEDPTAYLQRYESRRRAIALASRQLAALLLAPIPIPAGRRVLIVPDGPLRYIPFAALPYAAPSGTLRPFIEAHEVTMLPSASVLAALRRGSGSRPPPNDEIAVFADPVFSFSGSNSTNTPPSAAQSGRRRFHDIADPTVTSPSISIPLRLPGSRVEAIAIQQVMGTTRTHLALQFDASRAAILAGAIEHSRIVHFATHSEVDSLHPEKSELLLTMYDPRGAPVDGHLRLSDVYTLKLSADLVVLSSCESALGRDLGSEGVLGLPRGFLYAGAHRVVSSLWRVDDDATAALMTAFYRGIGNGESPNRALRDAQLTVIRQQRYADPYYWAAFVIEGEYE